MGDAVLRGSRSDVVEGVTVERRAPLETGPEAVLKADGMILGTTENFGYMSGALKDFFDRIYYPCLEQTQGLPYAMFIKAGNDGTGAMSSIRRIVSGLSWREVQAPVLCVGKPDGSLLEECENLGLTLAAGLEAGVF